LYGRIKNAAVSRKACGDAVPQIQLPAVGLTDGETAGVGTTGAVVTSGTAVGRFVPTGDALAVGTAEGASVGVGLFSLIEQVQPIAASRSPKSGIKKNRFIVRISFRFFFSSMPDRHGVMRLRQRKKYAILRICEQA
jgi:hypothetical protein